jgi:hypothetical protein
MKRAVDGLLLRASVIFGQRCSLLFRKNPLKVQAWMLLGVKQECKISAYLLGIFCHLLALSYFLHDKCKRVCTHMHASCADMYAHAYTRAHKWV